MNKIIRKMVNIYINMLIARLTNKSTAYARLLSAFCVKTGLEYVRSENMGRELFFSIEHICLIGDDRYFGI